MAEIKRDCSTCKHDLCKSLCDACFNFSLWELDTKNTEHAKSAWMISGSEWGPPGVNYKEYTCMNCGWSTSHIIPRSFCPRCGADMRDEEER